MTNETALRDAVRNVLSHRVGELPDKGYIRDTYISRAAIDQMARLLQSPSQPVVAEALPADVVALVIAARQIMDRGYVSTSIEEERGDAEALDRALERFSSRVCYDDEGGSLADAHASPCTCGPAHPQASPPPVQGEVTQADREAAAKVAVSAEWKDACRAGKLDMTLPVQTMRAHRIAHSQTETQEHVADAGKKVTSLTSELATVKKRLESAEGERGCTCHPDERPPVCQHKYALTDCLNLGAVKKAANLVFRIEAAGAWEYEDGNFERWKAEARRIAPDLRALQEQEKQNG